MGVLSAVLAVLLVVVTLAMIGLILIQRGKGGGLAGAFGGGGVEQAFGTRATTLAQKATAVLGIIFLVLTIMLGLMWSPHGTTTSPTPSSSLPLESAPASSAPESAKSPAAPASAATPAAPAPAAPTAPAPAPVKDAK